MNHPVINLSPYTRFVFRTMGPLIEAAQQDLTQFGTPSMAMRSVGLNDFAITWMQAAIERVGAGA